MKTYLLITAFLVGGVFVGCESGEPPMLPGGGPPADPTIAVDSAIDGLTLSIELPSVTFTPGQQFPVKIVATNTTDRPIRIQAGSGGPYRVYLWRFDGLGWGRIKGYPAGAVIVMNEWFLAPHTSRTFEPLLTVEPDWPTHEPLRLEAKINGRDDLGPFVHIEVIRPEKRRKRKSSDAGN
jgi:hypothetical protein